MYEFTMTNVKDSCPLFRQNNVSVETKVKNLQLLIYVQIMGYKATATMEDLESAIKEDVDIDLESEVGSDASRSRSIEEDTVSSAAKESIILPGKTNFWPPKKEFVSILLEDGFYIAQVNNVRDNKIYVSYLKPKQDNGLLGLSFTNVYQVLFHVGSLRFSPHNLVRGPFNAL